MLHIHNSLTRTKEPFVPIEPGKVRLYVCGMTVYDYCHLGHARVLVVFDVVLRYLRRLGELPDQTDKLFVVDQQDHLKGVLSLKRLLTLDPGATVSSVMVDDVVLETKRAKRPRRSSAMTW